MLNNFNVDNIIIMALNEDMPAGDITTDSIIDGTQTTKASIIAKQEGIIAGIDVFERVFKLLDNSVTVTKFFKDGDCVKKSDLIAEIHGNTRVLLKGERTALNLLQRLSGIATKTKEFCDRVSDLPVKIVDTRKTTPLLRQFEKYAVMVGGGSNHRFCLSDSVLIKDNHIKAAGSIINAIAMVKSKISHTTKIEVEVESIAQVKEAVCEHADIIMLDNMNIEMMCEAVRIINKAAIVEASGNVSLDNVRDIAKTGVDIISVGALTHSVTALDISMRIV